MSFTNADRQAETGSALIAEQLQVVCNNQVTSLPINSMLGLTIVMFVWKEVDHTLLSAWLTTIVLLNAMRSIVLLRQRRPVAREQRTRRDLWLSTLGAFASGSLWAVVPAAMLTMSSASAPLVLVVLCGITAGAAVQSGALAAHASAFVFPILMMLIVKLVSSTGEGCDLLALDIGLYLAMIVMSARRSEQAFVKTVLLRMEATALATSLDLEHKASKAAAARHFHLANHDPLTGLANRSAFASHLNRLIDKAQLQNGSFRLLLLDLDHFKSINDTSGHSAGDDVLKETARRLEAAIDGDHVVARLGGDEFAVLLEDPPPTLDDGARSDDVADRILTEVTGVFHLGEHPVNIGLSIGVAVFPDDGASADNLLAHADLALYAAKDGGRHRWRRFDAGLLAEATRVRDLDHDLPIALGNGSLQVFFQPQIALSDHRLTGFEALLRWHHPVHGWVPPPQAVASARRSRRSEALTTFVLDEACRKIRSLHATGVSDVLVAVNVSPSELDHYDLAGVVRRTIEAHGIEPARLEVEITEEAFAANDTALATLRALSAMGVRLAIDDFGTGCSALAYLRSMRVDRIKIDRSFVTGFSQRPGDRILVQAILGIGRSFGIEVLAEGVETAEEVLLLKAFGCDVVQGYYFGRPLGSVDLETWMASRSVDEGRRTGRMALPAHDVEASAEAAA